MGQTIFKPVSYSLSQLLGDIDLGKLALPELQRPFVWKKSEVRDLLDSMYKGFPVGHLMLWSTTNETSREIGVDGKQFAPNELLIDGQQRLTSLYAVIKGREVTFKDFSRGRIEVAFSPEEQRFEVADAAITKDPEFLPSITKLWAERDWEVINEFIERLVNAKGEEAVKDREDRLREALNRAKELINYPFQAVQIGAEVDEEEIAEVFLRVNSGGTKLTQADFILTLLSVFREEDRRRLEKFAEAAKTLPEKGSPSPFNHLVQPDADVLLRVGVIVGFKQGRLSSALALLRGASVEGDDLTESERESQLNLLSEAIDETLDLTHWHEYLKALLAAGYRRSQEISSENNVILVYALYLIGLRFGLSHSDLRTPIARYFFMSALTSRYTGSFETVISQDVQKLMEASDGQEYLDQLASMIDNSLTADFWSIALPQSLATSSARSPGLFAYAASLCLLNARVPPFVSTNSLGQQKAGIPIRDLFDPSIQAKKEPVDRHHLFPRGYLTSIGIDATREINQIANFSYVEWPENVEISDTPPSEYWPLYRDQFSEQDLFHHALPRDWDRMSYPEFLEARRPLIAEVVRNGFEAIGASPT
jgi:hypothetical protein